MSKKGNPAVIGAFVVGAVILLVAAVLLVAGGGFLTERQRYVLFFEGSVKGLRVGAPVTFRGVTIGQVTEVQMIYDVSDQSIDIPVFVELFPEHLTVVGEREGAGRGKEMPRLVERGLKAQLQMQSFVTSQLFVNFDFFPDEPVELKGVDMGVPELPTIQSGFQKIAQTVESFPVEDIAAKLVSTLDAVEKLVNAPELMDSVVQLNAGMREFRGLMDSPGLKGAIAGINETLEDLRELLRNTDVHLASITDAVGRTMENTDALLGDTGALARNADARLEPLAADAGEAARAVTQLSRNLSEQVTALSTDLRRLAGSAGSALDEVAGAVVEITEILDQDSKERSNLGRALEELQGAARSLRILAETLEQRPDALIRGKQPLGGGE